MAVAFSPVAVAALARYRQRHPELETLIREVLAQDPRPAYERADPTPRLQGMKLYNLDVRWEMRDGAVYVTNIVEREPDADSPAGVNTVI